MSASQSKLGFHQFWNGPGRRHPDRSGAVRDAERGDDFATTLMPGSRGWCWRRGIAARILRIPRTAIRGAWLLLAVFVFAILIHLMHGLYGIGNLVIYAAAAFALAVGKA